MGLAASLAWAASGPAQALDITVQGIGADGSKTPVTEFHYLVEEDRTIAVTPGTRDPNAQALGFHASYMPPVAAGTQADLAATLNNSDLIDPAKRYYISILPRGGFTLGGAPFRGADVATDKAIEIPVHAGPVPAAQIVVRAFKDTTPVNNQIDLPEEEGLQGAEVILEDAGGRYGPVGGRLYTDAFGNPLGTTYEVVNGEYVVKDIGSGIIKTDVDGMVTIQGLAPGKYGVIVIPPSGQGWEQTSTIEGTIVVDAWVKENEPPYFAEFGPPGPHVEIGFIHPFQNAQALNGSTTISGKVVNLHNARPPEATFFSGGPLMDTECRVALNDMSRNVRGEGIFVGNCAADGSFAINNVAPGAYQLTIWDSNKDLIFATHSITVNPDGSCSTPDGGCDITEIPVFHWFGRLSTRVFYDTDEDGFQDEGERGIPRIPVNLRFRDGTVYQTQLTDGEGKAEFTEIFPFFNWLVAEVDNLRLMPTGATFVVDDGGPVMPDGGWTNPSRDQLTPQIQADDQPYRTEQGLVITQGFQVFLGQTGLMDWGKRAHKAGENGGISGMVIYSITRAEDDPEKGAVEGWEPGVPNVQINLYKHDPQKTAADIERADVDNYPFGWKDGGTKGPEDVKRANGDPATFEYGDAVAVTVSDSWDESQPTGCPNGHFVVKDAQGVDHESDCYDGLRNYNQMRPAVFDGGYAFVTDKNALPLTTGQYIVEAVPPRAYEIVKPENKNVDFGDAYIPPVAQELPPSCVGLPHVVPPLLTLFEDAGIAAPFAGDTRALCDRKLVDVRPGKNTMADFHLMTHVPIAAHATGFILDDLANEFDPTSPQFGEKHAPSWVPVSVRDWTGREISRTYSDEWGNYNTLLPSTYTTNVPSPTGMSPRMATLCMNDPGPIPNPDNPSQLILDPRFDRQYSHFCYTFQFMPGTTTYLDTPVLPVSAFAGPDQLALDCEYPSGTPRVHSVLGANAGPYLPAAGGLLRIISHGATQVLNPLWNGPEGTEPRHVTRDYGFGDTQGTVELGNIPFTIVQWSNDMITLQINQQTGAAKTAQLVVNRANGSSTREAATVTVGKDSVIAVAPSADPSATPIQNAIDAAKDGDLILVAPGTYREMPILWKRVRLQGAGAGATVLLPAKTPSETLAAWRQRLQGLIATNKVHLLPGQNPLPEAGAGGVLGTEEGVGIFVLGKRSGQSKAMRIDGFSIVGGDNGAITVNGNVPNLQISNNYVSSNQGFFSGGIRLGHPILTEEVRAGERYVDADNVKSRIHHNNVSRNGGLGGAGGGISLYQGSAGYTVTQNYVCGNFTQGNGGGIGHQGDNGGSLIADNVIQFNQSFQQAGPVSGGGIYIGGNAPLTANGLSDGAGSVDIVSNVILGNLAGAGDGGGIQVTSLNGADLSRAIARFNRVNIVNNMITNNVAGLAGGGVSLLDSLLVNIINSTVANNDSTATTALAFAPGSPNITMPQPAGIVARGSSVALRNAVAGLPNAKRKVLFAPYSRPELRNDIIWNNRSFFFEIENDGTSSLKPDPVAPIKDMGVLGGGAGAQLQPFYSLLTSTAGYSATNKQGDPSFVFPYTNGDRTSIQHIELTTSIDVQPAFDEGGNFIDVRFGPLSRSVNGALTDYHILPSSPATSGGDQAVTSNAYYGDLVATDIDGNDRVIAGQTGIGADQIVPTPTITAQQ